MSRGCVRCLEWDTRGTPLVAATSWSVSRASEAELLAFKALAEADPTSALAQRDRGIGYIAVGDGQVSDGALEPALDSYRAAQAIARRLAEADPSSAQAQRDLAFCDNKVGAIRQRIGDHEGAVREHEAALAIVQRLAAADSANVRLDHDLVYIWSRIGEAKLAARDVAGALKAEEEALAIAEKLARDPVSHESQVALAQALGNHADGLRAAGKPDEARKQIARALGTLTPLLDKPDVPSAWTDLRTRLTKLQQEL